MNLCQADSWFDEATRALTLELTLHSFSARKFMHVRIMVELPAEGGVPLTHQSYITFNTFNSYDALYGLAIGDYGDAYWARLGDDGGGWMGDRCAFDGFTRFNPDHG